MEKKIKLKLNELLHTGIILLGTTAGIAGCERFGITDESND